MNKSGFQIFLENLGLTILTLIKIIVLSRFFLKKHNPVNKSKECIVLGNSPLLEKSLEANPDFLTGKDLFAVNFLWKSDYFTQIKPKYYVIVSTNFWSKNQIPTNKEGRLATFEEIARKVEWEMYLFVPALARKRDEWKQVIGKNPHIKIIYFNPTPIDGFRSWNHCFFRKGLGMPRPHNVLIPCLKIAIDMKYEKVYLLGAEHSWLKELFVGEDNVVYLSQKHFYDHSTAKPDVMYKGHTNDVRNLGETLMKFVYSFNSYYVLEKYAKSNGVKILNATKATWIDAFERYKLPNDY